MSFCRVSQYAETQARVLARIGDMPDTAQWRHIADTADIDTLIGRMRETGLRYWVEGLTRTPDTSGIEKYLRWRLLDFSRELGRLLPGRWTAARRWLETGGNLVFVQQVLNDADPALPNRLDPVLLDIAGLPRPQRYAALNATGYRPYGARPTPWRIWWEDLAHVCPGLNRFERHKLGRLRSAVTRHLDRICNVPLETAAELDVQWRWRNELAGQIRPLLSGDPFHIGLVFIYGVLDMLQFERCRALLVSVSRGWPAPDLFAQADV